MLNILHFKIFTLNLFLFKLHGRTNQIIFKKYISFHQMRMYTCLSDYMGYLSDTTMAIL